MTRRRSFNIASIAFLPIVLALASPVWAQERPATSLPLTLEDAVRRAVEHNPDLAIVRLGVDVEAARLSGTRGAFAPLFSTALGRTGTAAAPLSSLLGTEPVTTGEWFSSTGVRQRLRRGGGTWAVNWEASRTSTNDPLRSFDPALGSGLLLAFSQPLLRDRKIDTPRHDYEIAQRGQQTSELRFRESVAQTIATVKLAYWTLKAAVANVTVQQRSLELAQDLVRENRARVGIGQAPPVDLTQAEAEVATRRENLIRAETTAKDAEDHLRRLIMDPSDGDFWNVRLEPTAEPAGGPLPDVDRALSGALACRYDLSRARQDLADADSNVALYTNQKMPDVRFEASYRGGGLGGSQLLRTGAFPGTIVGRADRGFGDTIGQSFTNDFSNWSVGLMMSYPIGESYEKANLAKAQVERQQVARRIESLRLQIVEAIRQAGRQVQSTSQRVDAARAGETLAEQRLQDERRRFDAGLSTTFLVTQAQRDLLQAEVNLLQAMLDHQSSLVTFEAVQLASPAAAGEGIGVRAGAIVAIPTQTPRGLFRTGGQ